MIKAHARGGLGACPPDKFWISDLRSFLVLDVLLLNLVVVFKLKPAELKA